VASYKRGRNGLKGDSVNPDARLGRPIPTWAKEVFLLINIFNKNIL
jgi:hypothetical protein